MRVVLPGQLLAPSSCSHLRRIGTTCPDCRSMLWPPAWQVDDFLHVCGALPHPRFVPSRSSRPVQSNMYGVDASLGHYMERKEGRDEEWKERKKEREEKCFWHVLHCDCLSPLYFCPAFNFPLLVWLLWSWHTDRSLHRAPSHARRGQLLVGTMRTADCANPWM